MSLCKGCVSELQIKISGYYRNNTCDMFKIKGLCICRCDSQSERRRRSMYLKGTLSTQHSENSSAHMFSFCSRVVIIFFKKNFFPPKDEQLSWYTVVFSLSCIKGKQEPENAIALRNRFVFHH